jgi:hypothetical protein
MQANRSPDLARTTFQLLAIGALIVSSFWIVRPFLVASTWGTMIAVATWPLLLTDAVVRLAYHLRLGKVDPEALDADWNFQSDLGGTDPVTVLHQAIDQGRVHQAPEDLKPRYPFYTRLKDALADYRRLEAAGGWGGEV